MMQMFRLHMQQLYNAYYKLRLVHVLRVWKLVVNQAQHTMNIKQYKMGILDFVAAIKVHFCKLSTKSQEIKTETSACRYLTANKNNPHGKKTKRKVKNK